jgi:hypothetical protein
MAKKQQRTVTDLPATLDDKRINPQLQIKNALQQAEGETIVARPVSLDRIRVDMAQPRRGIPFAIRGGWDGSPDQIPGILRRWQQAAVNAIEQRIDTAAILNGQGELPETIIDPTDDKPVPFPAMVRDYIELMTLAHSIKEEGLINAITIVEADDGYMIETGERRYLAAWMIRAFVGGMETINAQVMPSFNLMRQAKENTARLQLNAISMARQLARLTMYLYEQSGEQFDHFHELVQPGKSDRPYYAQVENGYKFSVKGDWETEFLSAMNLPSARQVSAYRALLKLDDDMWIQADNENWSLNAIQIKLDERDGTNRSGQNTPTESPESNQGVYMHVNSTDDNPPSPTPDTDTLPLQPGVPDGHIEGSVGRIQTVHDQNTVSVLWGGSKIATRHDIAEIFPTDEQVVARAERGESAPVFGDDDTDPPFDITQKQFPSTPTWKDPHQNRVPLQPSDTPIHGGRSGVDVNIHTEPTPDPFKDRITYQRFDRVNTDWGQGVINAIRDSQYHIVTFDPETSTPSTRVMSANDITPLDAPVVGMWALVAESGALGIIERIDSDGSGIDIIIPESNRHLHRSASDIIIEYDYEPDQPQPDTTKPGLDITRVLNILDAFTIIANDPDHNPDHKIANDFIERFNTNQIDTITPDEIDHFLEIMEAELTESYTALIRHLESLKN